MMFAQADTPSRIPAPPPGIIFGTGVSRSSFSAIDISAPKYKVSMSRVFFDASKLLDLPKDEGVRQIGEAIRLADTRGLSELMIENFAGSPRGMLVSDQVVNEMHEALEDMVALACNQMAREYPVTRLTRRSGAYDLRCYMGREKPSDYVHVEDWISDSR